MHILRYVLLALLIPCAGGYAQEIDAPDGTVIASAEVSGLSMDDLSPGLRRAIGALAGEMLNGERLRELASRIEQEQPDRVAAVRSVRRPEGDARVIFFVARIEEQRDLLSNINARYIVERAEVVGAADTALSQGLRDDVQALVGKRLDPAEIERLEQRLSEELSGRPVDHRIVRGTEPGRLRVFFDASEVSYRFNVGRHRSKLIYHSDHAWSGALDVDFGSRNHRVALAFAFGNDDDLVEEFTGYGLRFESRKVVTDRLGVRFEVAKHRQMWQPRTRAALALAPEIPEPYRSRLIVEPAVTFAITPGLEFAGGVSINELQSLSRAPDSQMASAALAELSFNRQLTRAGGEHRFGAGYTVRAGTEALSSDLIYTRHAGTVGYLFAQGRSRVTTSLQAGRIGGEAPLFERFVLGDSTTLRGWDKYDIAPAGGNRMFHHSIEYTYRAFAVFLDTGSVWNASDEMRVRSSAGFGYRKGPWFATLGFPLNAGEVTAAFMTGVGF